MTRQYSPWRPSRRATARVTSPLPVPTKCPNCGNDVWLVNNAEIYGRPFGTYPYAYRCGDNECNSYVGLHPGTNIPLGTLANAAIRNARKRAKAAFNPIWEQGLMSRTDAYKWLAKQLGIANSEHCHIGWFDADMCNRVVAVCISK